MAGCLRASQRLFAAPGMPELAGRGASLVSKLGGRGGERSLVHRAATGDDDGDGRWDGSAITKDLVDGLRVGRWSRSSGRTGAQLNLACARGMGTAAWKNRSQAWRGLLGL
jgi:hypothetical protein